MYQAKKLFLFIILVLGFTTITAQSQLSMTEDSKISVAGTSTLHDWKAAVSEFEGSCQLEAGLSDSPQKGLALSAIQLSFKGETIDGGRGPAMNGKIKKALKVTEHPQITFEAAEASITDVSGKGFTITTTGTINIAGADQEITMTLEGSKNEDNSYTFVGSKALKMTDFQITPPSAMFGQIETKDDITVNFELQFKAK
jgi:hypothetical protein